MKKFVKSIIITVVTICSLVAIALFVCNLKPIDIKAKAGELKEYCIKNGYNTDYAILADYGRFSLQKRLFVYDFKQEKVIFKTLSESNSSSVEHFLSSTSNYINVS